MTDPLVQYLAATWPNAVQALEALGPPDGFPGIEAVFEALVILRPRVDALLAAFPSSAISSHHAGLSELVKLWLEQREVIQQYTRYRSRRVTGKLSTHPCYSSLSVLRTSDPACLVELAAQLLAAEFLLYVQKSSYQQHYDAWLSFRSSKDKWLLERLDEEIETERPGTRKRQRLVAVQSMLLAGWQDLLVHRPHVGHGQPRVREEDHETQSVIWDGSRPCNLTTIQPFVPPSSDSWGSLPGERTASPELLQLDETDDLARVEQQHVLRTTAAANAIAARNQHFFFDREMLTAQDLRNFLGGVQRLSERDPGLAAVLCVVLWSGRPLERALRFRWAPAADALPAALDHVVITESVCAFSVLAGLPDNPVESHLAHPVSTHLLLPVSATATRILRTWWSARGRPAAGLVFPKRPGGWQEAVDGFIKDHRKTYRSRLTLRRVEVLLGRLIEQVPGGDAAVAQLLTAQDRGLGGTQLYYSCLSADHLRAVHGSACEALAQRAELPPDTPPDEHHAAHWLGSGRCPTSAAVSALVVSLKTALRSHPSPTAPLEQIADFHNTFLTYSIMLIACSIGARGLRSTLIRPDQVDERTGLVLVDDKDAGDSYGQRTCWLPPVTVRQVAALDRHLRSMERWLAPRHPQSAHRLWLGREGEAYFHHLVAPTGRELEMSSARLEEQLHQHGWDLPLNAPRHYLRSQLLSDGCPARIIDAVMGHRERGLEPHGRHATLPGTKLIAVLSKHLLSILERDGWSVVEGLGR